MRRIKLTQGKFALVSDCDWPLVRQFKWSAFRNRHIWYAHAWAGKKLISLHRLIAGFPPFRLDHKNRNGLDNRRGNIRPATLSQNAANSKLRFTNTSGFKGVSWHKTNQSWQVQIMVAGFAISLGSFAKLEVAARAYRRAARYYFGDYARA